VIGQIAGGAVASKIQNGGKCRRRTALNWENSVDRSTRGDLKQVSKNNTTSGTPDGVRG